ncbi:MAG: GIY-YIG nuclease family protein [Bacteroidota bacterium]
MAKTYWVYILTNRSGTLYIGMMNDLEQRVAEHRAQADSGAFTARYATDRLVYAESYPTPTEAIRREKQLKAWRRSKKVALVSAANPSWRNLSQPPEQVVSSEARG